MPASTGLNAVAATRIRTSSGPGTGTSTSSSRSTSASLDPQQLGAYFALRFLVRYFSDTKRTLTPFAIYCLAAGLGCFIYLSVR